MYAVRLGNHRAVAILILAKKKKINLDLEIGKKMDKSLTARELVRLYDIGQLSTLNTNF